VGEQRLDVGLNGNPVPAQPGKLARVTADHRRGGRLHRACQDNAVRGRNGMNQRAPMRPPAPATISRMSDMETSPQVRLPV